MHYSVNNLSVRKTNTTEIFQRCRTEKTPLDIFFRKNGFTFCVLKVFNFRSIKLFIYFLSRSLRRRAGVVGMLSILSLSRPSQTNWHLLMSKQNTEATFIGILVVRSTLVIYPQEFEKERGKGVKRGEKRAEWKKG